jgi:hypothetical protein
VPEASQAERITILKAKRYHYLCMIIVDGTASGEAAMFSGEA